MTPGSENVPDNELMLRYQKGDLLAFQVLYQRHSPKVYGYLMKKVKDRAVADDVFQATFMKLHQSRSQYDSSLPFTPWLFTLCRNVFLDHLRVLKRRGMKEQELEPSQVMEIPAPTQDLHLEGAKPGLNGDLPDLNALPAQSRLALELRYQSDLSFEEIAAKLKTSPVNVRQIISRAIRRLRRNAQ